MGAYFSEVFNDNLFFENVADNVLICHSVPCITEDYVSCSNRRDICLNHNIGTHFYDFNFKSAFSVDTILPGLPEGNVQEVLPVKKSQCINNTNVSFITEQHVMGGNERYIYVNNECDDSQYNSAISQTEINVVEKVSSVTDRHVLASKNQNIVKKENHISELSINKLKICHLNVSGLQKKLDNGILDQFLSDYDLIFLVETNTESLILKVLV